jgi:hypothetical protein
MKLNIIFATLLLAIVITPITSVSAKVDAKNLVGNADFSTEDASGDPVGWFRGGYGNNTRSHSFIPCSKVYTVEDLLINDPNSANFVFRPDCPPNAKYRLQTVLDFDTYVSGDTKWYFKDVKVSGEKEYKLGYYYQPYTSSAQAIIRYTLKDGSYQYVLLADMPQLVAGGNGYIGWSKAENTFITPKKAKSLTVFFAITGNRECGSQCIGPYRGGLSIANVSLTKNFSDAQ